MFHRTSEGRDCFDVTQCRAKTGSGAVVMTHQQTLECAPNGTLQVRW